MNRNWSRRLGFESLENRRVLAGNVNVSVVNGDLIVRGDNLNNAIVVTQVSAGRYRISSSSTNATTINNGNGPVVPAGVVVDDVDIRMGAGHDQVNLGIGSADTVLPDDLTIIMGTGVDKVVTTRVRADAVNATLGGTENERDTLISNNSTFRGAAVLNFGGGNDVMNAVGSRVEGQLQVNLGAGNDQATINGGFAGSVRLLCGTGDDHGLFKGNLTIQGSVFADGGEDPDGTDLDTAELDPNANVSINFNLVTIINFEGGNLAP